MSASDAVQRALDTLLIEARSSGGRALTVMSVAARANISRSSMYRFHSEVVKQIQSLSLSTQAARRDTNLLKVRLLTGQLKAERDLTKALARACAELAAEKVALAEQLEEERLRFTLRLEALQKRLRGTKQVRLLHPTGRTSDL